MDIIRLYNDFNLEYSTEGHRHNRPGWVNCTCPFCTGNPGFHLGWNIRDEYYCCWRCGWHSTVKTLSELLNLDWVYISDLIKKYGINRSIINQKIIEKKEFEFPTGMDNLQPLHKKYLKLRGFDPDEIIEKWKIQGIGIFGKLGSLNYKFRIVIPFFWNSEIVSFDSRDVTGKAINKYQACPAEYEIVSHKKILYGNQEKWNTDLGICVEGPTDVWRIGEESFATSGIQYTPEQIRVMANTFKRIAVIYDDDPQAQVQAKKLIAELKFRNVDAFNVEIKGDPGGMTNKEVKELLQKIKEK
jgi:hypothetical protein